MINIEKIQEMVGLSPLHISEITQNNIYLKEQEPYFFEELSQWAKRYSYPARPGSNLFFDDFYEALISGKFEDHFYLMSYYQALRWHKSGLTEGRVMLLLSQCRQLFILLAENLDNSKLAHALCHVIDLSQSIISSIYKMYAKLEEMKATSVSEVKRIRRSFQLISSVEPESLIQSFVDHQNWKILTYSLALTEINDSVEFPPSSSHCQFGQWLDNGGLAKMPMENRAEVMQAHDDVHTLGAAALKEAQAFHPERILDYLVEMEQASDIVIRVLLDLIEEEFVMVATHDSLTNLPNRRAFDRKLKQNMAFAKRNKFWVGLVMIDIDHFKKVNDQYGHSIGDQVLKEMGALLGDVIRDEDAAFRWGGEEFTVLTLNAEKNGADLLAERIRERVEKNVFCADTQRSVSISVSCGVVCIHPELSMLEQEVFAFVDRQLYQSKDGGRNQVSSITLDTE